MVCIRKLPVVHVLTAGCLRLLFTAFQGNLDFCPFTDKTGQCKLLPKHQLVIEWLARGLQNASKHWIDWIVQCLTSPPTQYKLYGRRASKHAWARVFNTGSRQHVWTVSVQFKEYSQPNGRVSYHFLYFFFFFFSPSFVSLFSQKFLRSGITHWVRWHGRPKTCVGCLPKVIPVRLSPVLAARQKSSSETSRKEKFLTDVLMHMTL